MGTKSDRRQKAKATRKAPKASSRSAAPKPRRPAARKPPPQPAEPKVPADEIGLLTRRSLAVAMGIHPQTVSKWEQDGLPVAKRGRAGRPSLYREEDVRAWVAAREEVAKANGTLNVHQERARRERAQAQLAEQTFQMRQRDLLPRQDVEKAWGAEVAAVRTRLLSWPTTIADRVLRAATLDGIEGVEHELRVAVETVLRELADPSRIADPETPPEDHDDGREHAA